MTPNYRDDAYEKHRAIITAITTGAMSPTEAARTFGISRAWAYRLLARYNRDGNEGLKPTSRRPHTSPNKTPANVEQRIIAMHHELTSRGLDAGPISIAAYLSNQDLPTPHPSTIYKILANHNLTKQEPKKRPKTSWHRFEGHLPNSLWQSDFTHIALTDGTSAEVIGWLDDHSRYLLHLSAYRRVTGMIVIDTFLTCCKRHDLPAATLTDNGNVYTTRLARGGASGPNGFEQLLAQLGIQQRNGQPGHPTTQGKIERLWQTLKKWMTKQQTPATIAELNELLQDFRNTYNKTRPHRALGKLTPHHVYTTKPKDNPMLDTDPHCRVRVDTVNDNGSVTIRYMGKIRHLGVGRRHKGTRIILTVRGNDAVVTDFATKEILGQYALNPNRDYHPKT